jgi:hypothetical protein
MPRQAITQEELYLPLLRFVAERGGAVNRQDDDLLWTLGWELRLTREEFNRTTDLGRWQWKATVEYCRQKLIDYWDALEERGPTGEWRLTSKGRRLVKDPPDYMLKRWHRWLATRSEAPRSARERSRGAARDDMVRNGAAQREATRNGNGAHPNGRNGAKRNGARNGTTGRRSGARAMVRSGAGV